MDNGTTVVPNVNEDAPLEVRLRYDPNRGQTELHKKILTRLDARLQMSYDARFQRHAVWDETDKNLRMYLDLRQGAVKGDGTIDPDKKENPYPRGIVVPTSYAIFQVRLTQLAGIFLGRSPMLQIRGVGDEDISTAPLMEGALSYDAAMSRLPLAVIASVQNAERYGVAPIYDVWREKFGWTRQPPSKMAVIRNQLLRSFGSRVGRPQGKLTWDFVSEYNDSKAIDPRLYYPDPRVPWSDPQAGEFCGFGDVVSKIELQAQSRERGGPYFNLDCLGKVTSGRGSSGQQGKRDKSRSSGMDIDPFRMTTSDEQDDHDAHFIELIQVRLIPRDWGLSPVEHPQIWWFTVADEAVIIRAHPSAYDHGQFSISVGESNYDPHYISNPGVIELLNPSQRAVTWLFNSHFENIRRALNNIFVYLPSLIEEDDLLNPEAVQHIRMTHNGELLVRSGQLDINQAIRQLEIQDVTRPHIEALSQVFEMMQRMAAASDPQMAQPTSSKRTLGEVQAMLGASSQRVAFQSRILDELLVKPMVLRWISNRRQFTTVPQWVVAVGDLIQSTPDAQRLLVTPENLAGTYDYEPLEGIAPEDPMRAAEVWAQFLQAAGQLAQFPGVGQPDQTGHMLSFVGVLKEMAKGLGIRNLSSLFQQVIPSGQMPVSALPPEEVQALAQRGDIVSPDEAAA